MLVIFLFGGEGNFHQIEEKFKEKKKNNFVKFTNKITPRKWIKGDECIMCMRLMAGLC